MPIAFQPILFLFLLAFSCFVHAQSAGWPVYGGHAAADHYSSLSQINRSNVQQLKLAWQFDAGEKGGLETTPLIVGRVLYAYTANSKVIALDAATGQLIWNLIRASRATVPSAALPIGLMAKTAASLRRSRIFCTP